MRLAGVGRRRRRPRRALLEARTRLAGGKRRLPSRATATALIGSCSRASGRARASPAPCTPARARPTAPRASPSAPPPRRTRAARRPRLLRHRRSARRRQSAVGAGAVVAHRRAELVALGRRVEPPLDRQPVPLRQLLARRLVGRLLELGLQQLVLLELVAAEPLRLGDPQRRRRRRHRLRRRRRRRVRWAREAEAHAAAGVDEVAHQPKLGVRVLDGHLGGALGGGVRADGLEQRGAVALALERRQHDHLADADAQRRLAGGEAREAEEREAADEALRLALPHRERPPPLVGQVDVREAVNVPPRHRLHALGEGDAVGAPLHRAAAHVEGAPAARVLGERRPAEVVRVEGRRRRCARPPPRRRSRAAPRAARPPA